MLAQGSLKLVSRSRESWFKVATLKLYSLNWIPQIASQSLKAFPRIDSPTFQPVPGVVSKLDVFTSN